MTVFVVGSVRGSPGVTTTALLLASCLDGGAMVEADLDGGVLAIRYGLGREPGLTTLAAAQTAEPGAWRQHAQDAGGVPVLVGPDSPERASALWSRAGNQLAAALASSEAAVVDGGRLRPHAATTAVLAVASVVLVLARPVPEDLVGFSHRLPVLRRSTPEIGLVLVGRGSYPAADISAELGVDVLGELPEDRRALAMLTAHGGSARGLSRTPLARAARSLADELVARTAAPEHHEMEPATTGATTEVDE